VQGAPDIHIRIGPDATATDLALHVATVRDRQRTQGLLGLLRRVYDVTVGNVRRTSLAGEAYAELDKLPAIIQERQARLRQATDPTEQAQLRGELESLYAQYRQHAAVAMAGDERAGRGFVAMADTTDVSTTKQKPPTIDTVDALRIHITQDANYASLTTGSHLIPALNKLTTLGGYLEPALVYQLLTNAAAHVGKDGLVDFIGTLNNALSRMTKANYRANSDPLMREVITQLASTDQVEHRAALLLVERIAKIQDENFTAELNRIRALRSRLTPQQLDRIANLHRSTHSDAEIFNTLVRLVQESPLSGQTLVDSALTAGPNQEPDLFRLLDVVQRLPANQRQLADINTEIARRNRIRALASSDKFDFAALLFPHRGTSGTPTSETEFFRQRALAMSRPEKPVSLKGAVNAEFMRNPELIRTAIRHILGDGTNLTFDTNDLAQARWRNLVATLDATDLDTTMKAHILGRYWEEINLALLRSNHPSSDVFGQADITINGIRPRADALIIDSYDVTTNSVTLRLEEYKFTYSDKNSEEARGVDQLTTPQRQLYDHLRSRSPADHSVPLTNVRLPVEVAARLRALDLNPDTVKVYIPHDYEVIPAPRVN
jgi:hypothetical protein